MANFDLGGLLKTIFEGLHLPKLNLECSIISERSDHVNSSWDIAILRGEATATDIKS